MLAAATRNAGQAVASPDTCNTPTGTGVDVPTPYVNTASNTQATNFATTVLVECGNALNQKSSVPQTTGDESGTSHPVTKQEARYSTGNPSVFIEQSPAVTFSSLSTGNAMNASSGLVSVQSALSVYFTCAHTEHAAGARGLPALGDALGAAELEQLGAAVRMGLPSVTAFDDATGARVVRISRITEDVGARVASALASVPPSGCVVLDLRGNPGGDLDAALSLASDFAVENATLAIVRDADGDDDIRRSRGRRRYANPLVVLVDADTASAAEVLALALRSASGAAVLGGRTRGKSTVQRAVTPAGGRTTYETVAECFGPDGAAFGGSGLEPDGPAPPLSPCPRID